MANYKTAFGNFLKTEDLQGRSVRLMVESVTVEEVKGDTGVERKLICHFAGKDKGLILNRTNADMLAVIANSEDTDHWAGAIVVLYPDKTKFGAKIVDCMRIKEYVPADVQAQAVPQAQRPMVPPRQMAQGLAPSAPAARPNPKLPPVPPPVYRNEPEFDSAAPPVPTDVVVYEDDIPF
jgi:hypothetical protein